MTGRIEMAYCGSRKRRQAAENPAKRRVAIQMASSDMTAKAAVPEEAKTGFNWGAFLLTWIWGIGNNVWISFLVCLAPLVGNIYLGVKGNELAWLSRKWDSVEQFKQTQAAWSRCAWIVLFIQSVPLTIVVAMTVLRALGVGTAEGIDVPQ